VAAVEAIDPTAARVGRNDRYRLAAAAAADLVTTIDDGDADRAQAALATLRTRLVDAGLTTKGVSA
jgi:hypothetical protein